MSAYILSLHIWTHCTRRLELKKCHKRYCKLMRSMEITSTFPSIIIEKSEFQKQSKSLFELFSVNNHMRNPSWLKGLLTAASFPHPPSTSKLSGKSEAGIMIHMILLGTALPFSLHPQPLFTSLFHTRYKMQGLQYFKYDPTNYSSTKKAKLY